MIKLVFIFIIIMTIFIVYFSVPGVVMPLARLDALGLSLYGGTILPGLCEGKEEHLDAQSVMEVTLLNLPLDYKLSS